MSDESIPRRRLKALRRSETAKNISLAIAGVISSIAIPIAALVFTNEQKAQETSKEFVALGVKILEAAPSKESKPLREWAVSLVNEHARVKLTSAQQVALIDRISLPSATSARQFEASAERIGTLLLAGHSIGVDHHAEDADVSYEALRAAGVSFSYMSTYRSSDLFTESTIERRSAEANAQGVAVGLMHYFVGDGDPGGHESTFLKRLELRSWSLPPVIVCEHLPGVSRDGPYEDRLLNFLKAVEKASSARPIIRTTRMFGNGLSNPDLAGYKLWLVRYNVGSGSNEERPRLWSQTTLSTFAPSAEHLMLRGRRVSAFAGPVAALQVRKPS